jgi:hypothetical protein
VNDLVRQFLRARGCAEHVIEGGLEGLVDNWETTVRSLDTGYKLTLDDYLNDMDGRQLISEVLPTASDAQRAAVTTRLSGADEAFRRLTLPTNVSVWGDDVAKEEGWTAVRNWWYFARPLNADAEFMDELDDVVGD